MQDGRGRKVSQTGVLGFTRHFTKVVLHSILLRSVA